jgi:hypothetical protein
LINSWVCKLAAVICNSTAPFALGEQDKPSQSRRLTQAELLGAEDEGEVDVETWDLLADDGGEDYEGDAYADDMLDYADDPWGM